MKRIILAGFVVMFTMFAGVNAYSQYCNAGGPWAGPDYISNVSLGTINNNSTLPPIGSYQDYTSLSTDLAIGLSYTMTVTVVNGTSSGVLGVWIDWNKNQNFYDDPVIPIPSSPGTGPHSISIVVPPSASIGPTRMRIRTDIYAPAVDPCGSSIGGNVHDYTVNIVSGGANDAGIVAIDAPVVPVIPGTQNVEVSLQNFGSSTLTSAVIGWSVNGVNQTSTNWTGSLGQSSIDNNILLGTYNFTAGAYTLKAWSSMPNGSPDVAASNDTSSFTFNACNSLSGVYTIGGSGADYQSISEAALALVQCGVSGPTTFNIINGTYNERMELLEVPGASATNTITFQSLSANPADVTITANANGASDNYTVFLNGGDHYILKDLTIIADDSTYAQVILIDNQATSNILDGNIIISQPIARTSYDAACIVSEGELDSLNIIQNNEIWNGRWGISLSGESSSSLAIGNQIINNELHDSYYYGIYLNYQEGVTVKNNKVSFVDGSLQNYGLYLSYSDGAISIENNHLHLLGTGTQYGLYMSNCDASASTAGLVANNIISQTGNATSTAYGLYLYNCASQQIYHNTVRMTGTSQYCRALYVNGSGTSSLSVLNNIFSHFGDQYAFYVTSSAVTGFSQFDHNNFYSSSSTVWGYWQNGDVTSLSNLQTVSGSNYNSVIEDPLFYDPVGCNPGSFAMNDLGTPLSNVAFDINGTPRSTTVPDMGAIEYSIPSNDAGVYQINSPVNPVQAGNNPIQASIKNFGTATLTSVNVNYSVDGGTTATTPWTGSLAPGSTAGPLTLGSYNFPSGMSELKVWTSLPNGVADSVNVNDTISSQLTACVLLTGAYTIGDTAQGADFAGFNDAIAAMTSCGVGGPVIFNVNSGYYNEQVLMPEIPGASLTNRVTFQSSTGNAADVVLHFAPTLSSLNYVLFMDGADYIEIQNITIEADSSSYGRALVFDNDCDHNFINGNIIKTIESTSSNFCALYSYANSSNFNLITNNQFIGGYYGLYWYGESSSSLAQGNIIDGNTVSDFYYYGLRAYYQDGVMITNNTVSGSLNSGTVYNLYAGYCNGMEVSGNRVISQGSGSNYLLYATSCDGTSSSYGLIANNYLIQTVSAGTVYGIYISGSSYLNVLYNSVNISGGSSSSRGMYQYSSSNSDLRILNNIFAMPGGGYAMYTSTSYVSAFTEMDHNVLYTTGSNLAYLGSPITDLASWQSSTGLDSNSVSVDPSFQTSAILIPTSVQVNDLGTPVTEVLVDIDGNPRDLVNPDMGASEFDPPSTDMAMLNWLSPYEHGCGLSSTEIVSVEIFNNGLVPTGGFSVKYSIDGGMTFSSPEFISTLVNPGDTLTYLFNNFANMTTLGAYPCVAVINVSGDANPLNDTIHFTVYNTAEISVLPFVEDFESGSADYFYLSANTDAGISINSGDGNPGYGVLAQGGSGGNWVGGSTSTTPSQAWNVNTDNHANIASCDISAFGVSGLKLEVDLKMVPRYSWGPLYSWFRVVVNDTIQLTALNGTSDFNPVSTNDPYTTLEFDLTPYSIADFTVTFQAANRYTDDKVFIDNIKIYEPQPNDVGVTSIISPVDTSCAGPMTDVVVEIRNFGAATQTNVPVTAEITLPGGSTTTVNGVLTDSLHANQIAMFNVGSFNASTVGSYSILAYTGLSSDGDASNDTTYGTFATTSPNTVYPYTEDFETFTTGSPGTFENGWTADANGTFVWEVNSGATGSSNTGPNGDHTTGSGIYVYTEASSGSAQDVATLTSPCLDLSSMTMPQLKFWYHMYGSDITGLSVDVFIGGVWMNDVYTLSGPQQSSSNDPWLMAEVDLYNYIAADRIRFRVLRGASYEGDVCLDDILIEEAPANEAEMYMITAPLSGCDLSTETVSVKIINRGVATISGNLSASYQLMGGAAVTENVPDSIPAGDTLDFSFATPLNLSTSYDSIFELIAYVNLSGDMNPVNDTADNSLTSAVSPGAPVVNGVSISPGSSADLVVSNATAGNLYYWFDDSLSVNELTVGDTFTTPVLNNSTTYWVESRKGQLASSVSTGPGSVSSDFVPCYGYYDYSWSASVYRSEELNFRGNIDSISFYVNNTISGYAMNQQIIRLGLTNSDELDSLNMPVSGGLTTVFIGIIDYSGPGWVSIPLTSSFNYDGTENLLVVYENRDGSYASGYPQFRGQNVSGNMVAYDYADGSMPAGAGSVSSVRPDIMFSGNLVEGYNGCPSARISVDVTVSSSILNVNAGADQTICLGDSAQLNITVSGGTQPYSYSWNPTGSLSNSAIADPMAFPSSTTTYSVTVSDQAGYTGTDEVIITVLSGPNVTLVLPYDTVCKNSSAFMLSGGNPTGGVYSGAGVNAGMFDPNIAGLGWHDITYTYTDPVTGCSSSNTQAIFVDDCVGIREGSVLSKVRVYPVPARDLLNVIWGDLDHVHGLILLDARGSQVYARSLDTKEGERGIEIDLSDLQPGTYYLQVYGNFGRSVKKVVVL